MMQTDERKKIGRKFHSFQKEAFNLDQEFESQKRRFPGEVKSADEITFQVQAKKILKYAPRYIESLRIRPWKDAKLVNALKRVKKIRIVHDSQKDYFPNQWRLVLQHKFKSVQEFYKGNEHSETLEKFKAFSRIIEIRPLQSNLLLWNLFRYVPGMSNLQRFHFVIYPKTHPNLLKKLNSISKTLSSVKVIRIIWLNYKRTEQTIPLSSLIENRNILRSLTHLCLNETAGHNLAISFGLLPKYCKRLIDLSIVFQEDAANLNILESLEDFESLEKVTIQSRNLFSFFDHFTIPSSLKEIKLVLRHNQTSASMSTQTREEMWGNHQKLVNLCEKWRNIQSLAFLSLTVETGETPSAIPIIVTFVHLVLKSIPSLENFDFTLRYSGESFHDSVDLTDIFAALQKSSDRLQTIHLELPHSGLLTQLSKENITFPKLAKLKLSLKEFSDLGTIQNLFSAFSRSASLGHVKISLEKYIVGSNQALLDLLRVLRKPRSISKIRFFLEIRALELDTFDEMFRELIEEVEKSKIVQNVRLRLRVAGSCYGEKALVFIEKMFRKVNFGFF